MEREEIERALYKRRSALPHGEDERLVSLACQAFENLGWDFELIDSLEIPPACPDVSQVVDLLSRQRAGYGDTYSDYAEIHAAGERGIVVHIWHDRIEARLPTIVWAGGVFDPVPACHTHRTIAASEATLGELMTAFRRARRARAGQFRRCHYCGRSIPPEHRDRMDGMTVCHGCAEEHLGVLH